MSVVGLEFAEKMRCGGEEQESRRSWTKGGGWEVVSNRVLDFPPNRNSESQKTAYLGCVFSRQAKDGGAEDCRSDFRRARSLVSPPGERMIAAILAVTSSHPQISVQNGAAKPLPVLIMGEGSSF